MAVWAGQASGTWQGERPALTEATRSQVALRAAGLVLALTAGALLAFRLDTPALFDNEGRYAEVAREMVLGGDWVTPHLDFAVFLNKPPLLFWLPALIFRLGGLAEWARLVSVAAGVVALIATTRLGALLYGEEVGLVACLALATSLGFVIDARTLRPDMVLVAAVAVALLCWRQAWGRERRGWWLIGFYAALGVGVLTKGLVIGVIVGLPVGVTVLRERGWGGVRALRPGLGLLIVAAITLPWHVAVALRNPGFAWDYLVNQHILFFLGRKLPHDSQGDTLGFFWAAYIGRAMPWVLFLPLTLREGMRGARRAATAGGREAFLLWAWLAGVLAFFSCAPSRLEHYSLPALPATALLTGRAWQRLRRGEVERAGWLWLEVAGALVLGLGVLGAFLGPGLLQRQYWMRQVPALSGLVVSAAGASAGLGLLVVLAAARRRVEMLTLALVMGAAIFGAIVLRAEAAVEPLFSWRPAAHALTAAVPLATDIVFEAPEEYQLVGGLAYYTGRRIKLIEPPGFVPPGYLAGRTDGMFLTRADFERRWRSGTPLAFVSDPQRRRESPAGLVPDPFRVVGRFGDRWVLATPTAVR